MDSVYRPTSALDVAQDRVKDDGDNECLSLMNQELMLKN
jgi:hypothetical protein